MSILVMTRRWRSWWFGPTRRTCRVYGIVKNAIPLDEPDRDQKIEDVLRIVERYRNEVRSISGIRALVARCKAKGYRDLDDDDIANIAAEQEAHAAECLSEN